MAIVETKKLQFDIQEIPEGQSYKNVALPEDYFTLADEIKLLHADIEVSLYRTDHFIKVSFELEGKVELVCDRSLDLFEHAIEGEFDILFQPGEIQESETAKSAVKQIPADLLIIDIEGEVRDTIMLNMPIKKIHPRYLDESGKPKTFETAEFGKPGPDEEQSIDPRWEKLKKLK